MQRRSAAASKYNLPLRTPAAKPGQQPPIGPLSELIALTCIMSVFGHLLASPHTDGPNGTSKPTRGPVSTRRSNISTSLTIILLRCRCEVSRCRQTLQAAVRLQLIITAVHATSAQAAVNNAVSIQSVSTQPVLRRLGLPLDLPFDYKGFASPHGIHSKQCQL